jgi:hypothetical protein
MNMNLNIIFGCWVLIGHYQNNRGQCRVGLSVGHRCSGPWRRRSQCSGRGWRRSTSFIFRNKLLYDISKKLDHFIR